MKRSRNHSPFVAVGLLLLSFAATFPSLSFGAVFQDYGLGARSAGMGNAFTAVADDSSALIFNPAGLAGQRETEVSANFLDVSEIPSGSRDLKDLSVGLVHPLGLAGRQGTLGALWRRTSQSGRPSDRLWQVSYGLRDVAKLGSARLDLGAGLKFLDRPGQTHVGADVGVMLNFSKDRSLGAAVLPDAYKIGFARHPENYVLAVDWTQRKGGYSFAAGAERWWATKRHGWWSLKTGASLGNLSSQWAFGYGHRILGAEFGYALMIPLASGRSPGHVLSLGLKFGGRTVQQEYEELLSQGIKERQELANLLSAMEGQIARLKTDLAQSRLEMEALQKALDEKSQQAQTSREKLDSLMQKQKRSEQSLEELERSRAQLRLKQQENEFQEDWAAYLSLKKSGASAAELRGNLEQFLRKYRGKGKDLSAANQEMLRLLQGR